MLFAVSLVLFFTPALAQDSDHSKESLNAMSVNQLSTMSSADLESLKGADEVLDKAKEEALAAPDDEALKTAKEAAQESYDLALANVRATRDALKAKEGDTSTLGPAILAISGDMAHDGGAEATLGLVKVWTEKAKNYAVENGPIFATKLAIFLLVLFVFRILSNLAAGITKKALSTSRLNASALAKNFFVGMVRKLVFFTGFLIALGQLGVDTGPLLAGVGVLGFVVGFALQDTLGHFASGIMILLYRPFDVGDVITAGGETGKVEDLTLVSTTLLTPDNQKLIMPNSSIWGGTIRNITAQHTRRIDFTVGVGYSDDLDKTQKVLLEVASSHDLVLKDPGVQVEVVNLGESSVDFVVRPWVKTSDYWDVFFDLNKAFKQRLDAEGISIPFPQRDLHIIEVPQELTSNA